MIPTPRALDHAAQRPGPRGVHAASPRARSAGLVAAFTTLAACAPPCDCEAPGDTEVVETDSPAETDLPVETDLPTPPDACGATTWIAWSPTGVCDDLLPAALADHWTAWPLLLGPGEPTREALVDYLELPPELRGYCELAPSGPEAPPLPTGLADPDCGVVAALADPAGVSAAMLGPLRDQFRAAAGGPVEVPSLGPVVRVALIDTQVTAAVGEAAADQARHGCAMRSFMHDLTCEGDCPMETTSVLALDRVPGSPPTVDPVRGGFYGTQGTLARRIVQAVSQWRRDGRPGPLIVHLAVGWDPQYSSPPDAPGALSLAARAVRDAVEHTTCDGGLVIAAAGNETGGPLTSLGPMFPAGWAAELARCGGPLLHAVDAVGPEGSLVLRARPRATPRLVAPGFHAMADVEAWSPGCGVGGAPVTSLTGSSVATAVTAAAAAAVWRVRPELRATEVMDLVWSSGSPPAGPPPDGGWWAAFGPAEPVRQVSVCAALKAACDGLDPAPAGCASACPSPAALPWGYDPGADVSLSGDALGLLTPPACGAGPCPHDTWVNGFGAPASVSPTPSSDGCAECWWSPSGLHLVINPELRSPLLDPRVVWFDAAGGRLGVHDLATLLRGAGRPDLQAGEVLDITGLRGVPTSAAWGRLEARVRFGGVDRSMSSEVAVGR
jgi:hypothetical protein